MKYLREGESKLYIEKDFLTALKILNSSYKIYPDINEKIKINKENLILIMQIMNIVAHFTMIQKKKIIIYMKKKRRNNK